MVASNAPPHRSYSIITRLTLGYCLMSIGVLSSIALFLYYTLVDNIQNKDLRFLVDKILHLRNILKEAHLSQQVLEQEVNEGGGYQFHKFLVRIMDSKETILMVTTGGSSVITALPFPTPHEADEDPWKFKKHRLANGKTFLMMSAWAQSPNHTGGRVLLNTAIDITEEQKLLTDYRNLLLYTIFFGVFLISVLTMILSRYGLRPLKSISDKIDSISVHRLHERLNPQQWPLELGTLVLNFDSMLDRLEDSVNRLSRFSSDIAHDLRTPIQTLRGEAEIILSKSRTAEQYQEHIESCLEEYEKLTHMIEGLLFVARAENAVVQLNKTEFDILPALQKILAFYEALIEEKSITVVLTGKGSIYADRLLFERAMSNLVSNAIKYARRSGKITLHIKEEDRTVSVSINNTGSLIDPGEINNIFNRFYRTPGAKAADHEGLGLGLTIVKSIVDMHGGTIQTQSDSFTGTTFTLTFLRT